MAKVERDNRERLAKIAACDPVWSERFGNLDALSTLEMELWYWRYAGETIHHAGAGNPRYQLVRYEELTRNPTEISRSVFQGCGLEWNAVIEQAIRELSVESEAIAAAWRTRLSADHVSAVERVLGESPMQDWWGDLEYRALATPAESQHGGVPDVSSPAPQGGFS